MLLGATFCAAARTGSPAENAALSSALHAAVRAGNLKEIERLVAAGASVDGRDQLGSTPLMLAAWSGHAEVARFLLAHGADVNALSKETRSTALEYAVITAHSELVRVLLAAGARVDFRYRDEQTVLHLAATREDPQIVELLLGAHAEVGAIDGNGNTPLDEAVLHSQTANAAVLIAHGADVRRVRPQDGRGPLHEACIAGNGKLVALLADTGADLGQRDSSGQTPLDLALDYQNASAVAAILGRAAHSSAAEAAAEQAMERAVVRGRTETVRMLIQGGFDIGRPTTTGSTYMHDAALHGQVKVVQLLLERGAGVDARNRHGETALHDAALAGNADVMKVLLDRGAVINAIDADMGATPLMLAASLGRTRAVAFLLSRGANPLLRDRAGRTALDRAKETGDSDLVKLLETAIAGASPAGSGSSGA